MIDRADMSTVPDTGALVARGLTVRYAPRRNSALALRDVSFSLSRAQSICIVGASGSSKTTLFKSILGLLSGDASVDGDVSLPGGHRLHEMSAPVLREYRRTCVGAIFQDAPGSLIPGVALGRQLERVFSLRRRLTRADATRAAREALFAVGFPDPAEVWHKAPVALSGGMSQRCMIAMSLLAPVDLKLIAADEPISSLDPVSAAQVLDLLLRVQKEKGATMLFVAHDLRLLANFDFVGVMAAGALVELQRSKSFLAGPASEEGRRLLTASQRLGQEWPNERHPSVGDPVC